MGFIAMFLWFVLKLLFTSLFWIVVLAIGVLWLIAFLAGQVGVGPLSDSYHNN